VRSQALGTEEDSRRNRISGILKIVEELRRQLEDFERVKQETRATIESAINLIPRLEDEKARRQEDLGRTKEKIEQVNSSILNLKNLEQKIQIGVRQDHDQISRIDDQMKALSRMMCLEM
jgi:chromosome segregation ATPase